MSEYFENLVKVLSGERCEKGWVYQNEEIKQNREGQKGEETSREN